MRLSQGRLLLCLGLVAAILLVPCISAQESEEGKDPQNEEKPLEIEPVEAPSGESSSESSEGSSSSSEESSEENPDNQPNLAEEGLVIEDQPIPLPVPPPPPPPDAEKPKCETNYTEASGRFSTPGFPEPYPGSTDCTWNITVEEGKRVQLTFHLFNVEHNPSCHWDYVRVYDSNGTVIKHICGYLQQDLVVTSTGNSLKIHFYSDGVIEAAGFLASWTTVEEEKVDEREGDEGYILTFPQTFTTATEGSSEHVCLQLFNVATPGEVKVSFFDAKNLLNGSAAVESVFNHDPSQEAESGIRCQFVKLPQDFPPGSAIVRVDGSFKDSDYKILSYKSVRSLKLEPLILVQTDKSDYRPKQTVRFRVLMLNYELKPSVLERVREAWVTDPQDSRLFQWKSVDLKKGLAQRDFELPEEPVLGTWTIHVLPYEDKDEEVAVKFTVSENVLPKFEVNIEMPDVVLFDSEEASFRVCAQYTHGSKVKGNANVTFFSEFRANYWRAPLQTVNVTREVNPLDNGCVEVKLNNSEIVTLASKGPVKVLVEVEEAVTGIKQNATDSLSVKNTALDLSTGASATEHIVGGFPYVGQVQVSQHNGAPASNIRLKLCARLFTDLDEVRDYVNSNSHRFYSYSEDDFLALSEKLNGLIFTKECLEAATDEKGAVKFSVPLFDIPENVTKLSVLVEALDHVANETTQMLQSQTKLDVGLTQSNSTSALTIFTAEKPRLDCAENSVTVFFASPRDSSFEISHFVTSGAAILASGFEKVQVGSSDLEAEYVGDAKVIDLKLGAKPSDLIVGKHQIAVNRPLTDEGKVAKTIKVLIYTRDKDGNTLSASREFEAESCASQPLVQFSSEKLNPGDNVSLSIKGSSEALCGYSIVDKSVELVPNPNKVTTPRVQELKEEIAAKRIVSGEKQTCHNANLLFQAFEQIGLFVMSDQLKIDTKCDNLVDATNREREEEPIPQPVPFIEADQIAEPQIAFAAARPLGDAPPGAVRKQFRPVPILADEFEGGANAVEINENKIELRNFFPETWLFDLIDLDVEGKASLDLKAPHSITTWIAEVFCSDNDAGLEISNATTLLVTQDFFADINMPYSVKRGEILPVNISVFNSVERNLPMKLTIQGSDSYKLDQSSQTVCLSAQDNEIKTFNVKAQELHEVNITVEAKITSETDGLECEAAGSAEGYTDVLQKSIQVKPEGFPVEKVQSVFQCNVEGEEAEPVKFEALELPEDLVEGSERAWVTATGDIMAPALANLDKLVTLPVGCGEQNMITMAPNVYLMNYLTGTGKKEPEIEAKAKKYMTTGFQREQEYRHSDGAYSVWGPKQDKVGSMWLTAFVVKVFSQASRFVEIPAHNVQESVDFMLANQLKDGCFNVTGYVIHSELAGTDITASALVTLLEIKKNKVDVFLKDEAIKGALECVKANLKPDTDPYTRAISLYALSLYNENFKDENTLGELVAETLTAANTSVPGRLFWAVDSLSRSVEITAYNVMSLLMNDKLPEALQAIRWLATHRNSQGGFVSTQDTMVALQAMSEYSLKVSQTISDISLKIKEKSGEKEHSFAINGDNNLLLQSQKLTQLPNELEVELQGQGCFMVQSVLRYNKKESPDKTAFTLTASQLSDILLEICSAYTGNKEKTDMVVIEVELLSGFGADLQSLETLQNEVQAPVKKFEYDAEKGTLVLYFDDMPKETTCWKIDTKREIKIEELKPALVKVYDYYNQEDMFSTEYSYQL